ncbi:L-type lectin-domain containing receptor kinase IX.1-like [Papaver somniferum]|uniref:L-type lectin-domain containing receptor kinase IX.1-like n=1 Tax=Papaver somniferum TaxID=3469 RepID=UPI000E6FADB4|nr:L-type lectin-domain containing receptor kinase IX.1-like [Papaver somniferum]
MSLYKNSRNSFFILLFLLVPPINSIYFNKSRFEPQDSEIILEGDAATAIGTIELINRNSYTCRVGRATYFDQVPLWDSVTGEVTHFVTHFTFSVEKTTPKYGAGLAFFIAPVGYPIPPNSPGGFLGLFNTTTTDDTSRNQIIHVEFDSFPNEEWEPDFTHVGINNNSIKSAVSTFWKASLHSQETGSAWITYNATAKNLSVYWTYDNNPVYQGESLLSYQVDLKQILPERVTIGFSAGTGMFSGRHILLSWDFNSSLAVQEKKVPNEKPNEKPYEKPNVKLIIGLSVAGTALVGCALALVLVCLMRSKRRRARKEKLNFTSDFERGTGPRRFLLRELVSATNNFSEERKLGEGGFGGVYRGFINEMDLAIAVKKISSGSRQGQKEYITEVRIISRLRHRNLVQLIGWCHESGEFLLVYELMPNGSLDAHLFGRRTPLMWAVRYKIALGLASALLYLHEEGEQCVVHRDIKSSNIMLDSNFNAKLGDFGLARLTDHGLGLQSTGLAGTLGYLAPEYVNTGKASKESDVFSFGVVCLEIACGRKSIDYMEEVSNVGLVEWVWDLYGRDAILAATDHKLNLEFEANQAECLMVVGLWCAHPDRSSRPSIRQAIQALNMEASIPSLPTKMPVPTYLVPVPELDIISSERNSITTTSMDIGR